MTAHNDSSGLRVGVVGPALEDDFAANILQGLSDLGIPAVSLGLPAPAVPGHRSKVLLQTLQRDPRLGARLERGLVRRARQHEVGLVITVTSLRPETVRALRDQGSAVALWFPDHVANLGSLWMFDAPYDGVFFKEPVLVRRVNALLDLPVHYLPEACNPRIHRPVDPDPEAAGKVVVVGNLHPIRARLLERLASDGIPLAIYGNPDHASRQARLAHLHTRVYLRGQAKSAVFAGAAAVLNNLMPAEIEGMNCRLFEATAAGGAVVTERRRVLPELFEIGTEVVAFENYAELLFALRSLIADPNRGQAMGAAASQRALVEHTYEQRLTELLGHVL